MNNDKARRESKRAYDKNWRTEHPEYDKEWYSKHPELKRKKARKWNTEHPEYRANSHLKREYNITLAQKREMWLRQWRLCAICCCDISTLQQAQVDHNHDTDEVRGILCSDCNRALGCVKEDKDTLINMIEYLQTFN
jgi:hypothetical protein